MYDSMREQTKEVPPVRWKEKTRIINIKLCTNFCIVYTENVSEMSLCGQRKWFIGRVECRVDACVGSLVLMVTACPFATTLLQCCHQYSWKYLGWIMTHRFSHVFYLVSVFMIGSFCILCFFFERICLESQRRTFLFLFLIS